jgi:hypothetical protein
LDIDGFECHDESLCQIYYDSPRQSTLSVSVKLESLQILAYAALIDQTDTIAGRVERIFRQSSTNIDNNKYKYKTISLLLLRDDVAFQTIRGFENP